jgi:pimeloyl-ACP methyl ester carboxylesterase
MSEGLKHDFAYSNGIRMHYVEQGEGPLVLLCHGWPESWYSWRHQIPALAAAGYRVVAPDQRGYGLTDAPTAAEAYDVLRLAGDLVGLVNALGEEQAVIVGHDWGSMVAAPTALLRPDMFRALGLLSVPYLPRRPVRPSARFHMATQERHFYQDYFQQPGHVEKELEEDIRRTLLGVLYIASGEARTKLSSSSFVTFDKKTRLVDNLVLPEEMPPWLTDADLDFFVEQFKKSGFRGPINWYRNIDRNWEITPFLDGAKILQPTLFVTGSLDGVLKMAAEEFEALEANVPKLWRKHLIPGVGHWVQQEQPEEVNRLLLAFLSTYAPVTGSVSTRAKPLS